MTMEKYGVKKEIQHDGLRDEEARLMQELQKIFVDNEKTASDRARIERQLQAVRQKLTELDLQNT